MAAGHTQDMRIQVHLSTARDGAVQFGSHRRSPDGSCNLEFTAGTRETAALRGQPEYPQASPGQSLGLAHGENRVVGATVGSMLDGRVFTEMSPIEHGLSSL